MTAPLTDRDHALVEAVALRVVALLADEHAAPPTARLVDAAELADLLGVARSWVYDNAERIGGVRLGDGPRGRLRFDVERALTAWRDREPEPQPEPQPRAPRRRAPRTAAPSCCGFTARSPVPGATAAPEDRPA
jgi:hypothetical protein